MPLHGNYDRKHQKWFCTKWMDRKQWLEIHGYPPNSTIIESDGHRVIE